MAPVGTILRRWRQAKGMRQEDLEAATGIAQAHISDIERGDIKDPGFSKVETLVKALGKSLDELTKARESEAARRQPAAA